MVITTKQQRKRLFEIFCRTSPERETPFRDCYGRCSSEDYRAFRRSALPEFAGHGAILVPWCGMWVGIERDGYAHT